MAAEQVEFRGGLPQSSRLTLPEFARLCVSILASKLIFRPFPVAQSTPRGFENVYSDTPGLNCDFKLGIF